MRDSNLSAPFAEIQMPEYKAASAPRSAPEGEAVAAGRAGRDVAQALVEKDCEAIRYRHRRYPLDAAACNIDRKIDIPYIVALCLAGRLRTVAAPRPFPSRASSRRRQRVSVAFRAHHQPCLCRKWGMTGDFGDSEIAMSAELLR